jgi:GNAT superfamily N-acetyltransferase
MHGTIGPEGFAIRQATPADGEAVTRMLEASYATLMQPAYEPLRLAAALFVMTRANPKLLASGTYYAAVLADGRIAGAGGWSLERPGTGEIEERLAHIRHFGVSPSHKGLGLGRALCQTCELNARLAGIGRFEVYSSLNAEGFYEALGFVPLGPWEITLGEGVTLPAIRMCRVI